MTISANILISLVALLHLYFLILEMFLWDKPAGLTIFRMSSEKAKITKVLAANQGLYNGFLAAGIIWGLLADGFEIKLFFLSCIIMAGVFGAFTVNRKIFYIQSLPAIAAALLLFMS